MAEIPGPSLEFGQFTEKVNFTVPLITCTRLPVHRNGARSYGGITQKIQLKFARDYAGPPTDHDSLGVRSVRDGPCFPAIRERWVRDPLWGLTGEQMPLTVA